MEWVITVLAQNGTRTSLLLRSNDGKHAVLLPLGIYTYQPEHDLVLDQFKPTDYPGETPLP
jgi:hypothetical protein